MELKRAVAELAGNVFIFILHGICQESDQIGYGYSFELSSV